MKKLLITLSFVSLSILFTIEYYNHKAGNLLPRITSEDVNNPKWRILSPSLKKQVSIFKKRNNIPYEQDLTDSQLLIVENQIHKNKQENTLRNIVGTWGLFQYPLSIVLIILGILNYKKVKDKNKVYIYFTITGTICLSVAIFRSYFTSLGW